jgi:hypothetical protein
MRRSKIFVAMACLSVFGCSADYPLKAFFKAGQLYFDGAERDWFFGRAGFCPEYFSVQKKSGETVWRIGRVPQIEADGSVSQCKLFPVAYGIVPKGWENVVPAEALEPGELYVLKGEGGDAYHGAFRYRERRMLSVENEPELARKFPDPLLQRSETAK